MATVSVATPTFLAENASVNVLARAIMVARKTIRNLRHRSEIRQLAQLDAHLLKDIGLTPQDVVAALEGPLTVDPSRHLCRVAAGRGKWRAG